MQHCASVQGFGVDLRSRSHTVLPTNCAFKKTSAHRKRWLVHRHHGTPGRQNWASVAHAIAYPSPGFQPGTTAATVSTSGQQNKEQGVGETLTLGCLFGAWYLFNIWFNIFNKQTLRVFPFPITCTLIQFAVGAVLACMFWATGALQKPQVTPDTLGKKILPLSAVHTLGNLLTNVSLGAVAVSFTHTIKALEPFFSVLLSTIFLSSTPSMPVLLTLLPIVGGVAIASLTEASFNWLGFASAMGSNLTFQSRNVLSKKLMLKEGKQKLDNINLFSLITVAAFFLLLPVTLALEGFQLAPATLRSMGVANVGQLYQRLLMSGLCFHLYQQVSYIILSKVSPVTHSVGNCVKRVVVIVASVLVFRNPVSVQNAIGTGIALAGVFAYSQVSRRSKQQADSKPLQQANSTAVQQNETQAKNQ